ncbi:hypothetical protein MPH_11636 [Macrophomina phaseolina MS6]|uniref:FAS1 domain-containing protein n=1 Tax=Macrophomina phaseolina (strain MS6) TaxID=1126212 RepID=K2QMZ5_MACPH|nr:hypothetical protein MPH_11636 [Macrophomina phaseolina MS6]
MNSHNSQMSLYIMIPLLPLLFMPICSASPYPQQEGRQPLEPLLTAIGRDPDLSIFYSLFNGTGGSQGVPGPALEERFNDERDGREYTAFAPTNEAFSTLSPDFISTLTAAPSYELLLAILRTHIVEGDLPPSDLVSGPVESIQGFTLSFDNTYTSNTTVTTNTDVSSSDTTTGPQALLLRDEEGPAFTPASNGRIYKLSRVLNPFTTYFGADAASISSPSSPPSSTASGTVTDILLTHPNLSILSTTLEQIDPDFLTRLTLFADGDNTQERQQQQPQQIYLAPSNAAFAALPADALARATQPSNAVLSAWLLSFGLTSEVVNGSGRLSVQQKKAKRSSSSSNNNDGDLVFGPGGWRQAGEPPRVPLRVPQKTKFGTSANGSPAGAALGQVGKENCDLVFGVGGYQCKREERKRRARAERVRREAEAQKGCDLVFGVGGYQCAPKEKRGAGEAVQRRTHQDGCDWRFVVGGWKKFCPRDVAGGRAERSLEKRQVEIPASGVLRSVSGFNITINEGRVNNARVEEIICAENGCVWIVGRWLDPVFGAF